MEPVLGCPGCAAAPPFERLHRLILRRADYADAERNLQASNNYQRNHILFAHVLPPDTEVFAAEFVMCSACGLIFFTPRPTDADLDVKYGLLARDPDSEARERLREWVDVRTLRAKAIVRRLAPYLPARGRALDIGGADGHCLGELTRRFDCGLLDCEPRKPWPGVHRLGGTLADLEPSERFEVVVACHVLEHVAEPVAFLAAIRERLSERGILYLEVPYGCAGEIYGTRNVLTHLNFFSRASLRVVVEGAGLHVEWLRAGAFLSRKRYLPVIGAVARHLPWHTACPVLDAAAQTRQDARRSLAWTVFLANLGLVMRAPHRYAAAAVRRLAPSVSVGEPSYDDG
jgi:Methyltransferase domain